MTCAEDSFLPGWEWTRLIARGTHSDIHEIVDKEGKTRRVAKTIRLPLQLGEDRQTDVYGKLNEIFENEKRLCQLEHKNIVRFLDMSLLTKEPSVVVAMELVDGPTLESFINKNKPLDFGTVSQLANQVCSALCYLHTFKPRAIIHRDINCRTIMVSDDKKLIKLIDFGLAVQLVESATDHVTGNPRGDPAFMAPELFLTEGTEDTPYSCASDIWAFGCVIYQLVTGNRPHGDCRNMLAIVRRVKNQGAPKLPETCPELLKEFYALCTAKQKSERKPAVDLLKHPFLHGRALAGPSEPDTETENLPKEDAKVALPSVSSSSERDIYETAAPTKGLCLIISIDEYIDSPLFAVKQNHKNEVQTIKDTFKKLRFVVEESTSPSCTDFWRLVDNVVTAQDLSEMGSFVCFIMGHGTGGSVFASDGEEIEVRDIVARFRASQCSGLKGKPKIFFIQTETQPEGLEPCSIEESSFRLPENDFLLCSGGSSGSFADAVCNAINDEKLSKEDIVSLVAEVNKRLGLSEINGGSERFGTGASAVTSMTKKFFLDDTTTEDILPSSPDDWSDQQLVEQCSSLEKSRKTFGPMNQTPLTIASVRGRCDLVSEMLKQSLEVSAQDVQGRTALGWAALKGHKDVLAAFKTGFQTNASALKIELNRKDNLSQTPLILAAKNNRADVLELLVEMGADINCQDVMKCSAVSYAAKLGFEQTTRKLCDLNADLKLIDFSGNTPLIWAARCGHKGVLGALRERLNKPADLDHWKTKGERKMNAQEWAKFCEHLECAAIVEKCIQRLASLTSGGLNFEPSDDGNNDPGSGGQPPSGSGGREEGGEEGATGGGEPSESPGGQEDSVSGGPYPMEGLNRGIALIINIHDFVGLDLQRREGSMADMSEGALYHCFTTLGFDCRQVQNVNGRFFTGLPTNICSEEELNRSKAIIVCIMSHGGQDFIFAHDGKRVLLELVYSRFQLCQQLKDKPKLFFIQSCREELNQGHRLVSVQMPILPQLEDCLYFYSTSRGRSSTRDAATGGLFTQVLCSVVANNYQPDNEEFTAIVTRVIIEVFNRSGGQQVPCCELSIRRPLEFPTLGRRRQNAAGIGV